MKKSRGYQLNFSEMFHKQMYNKEHRKKAKTIIAVYTIKSIFPYFVASYINSILDIARKAATIKVQRPEQHEAVCCTTC